MPADVEQKILVANRAADAAHIDRILLDDEDRRPLLAQAIGGRQASRPRANDEDLDMFRHKRAKPEEPTGPDASARRGAKANRRWPLYEMSAPTAAPATIATCGSCAKTVSTSTANTA